MKIAVVVPTLNSIDDIKECIPSLKKQSVFCDIIVVANGTTDGTQRYLSLEHPEVTVLSYLQPLGFAGAVNAGIRHAVENKYTHIALLNNDAIADRKWLEFLVELADTDEKIGIVTSKIKHYSGDKLDSTGDYYTTWFLPYPRGRNVRDKGQYDKIEEITSASGGASLYKVDLFKDIGLFDEDFFAYYEDVDISLRAHHAGWKVMYQPKAEVYHKIGATSSRIRGFTTTQTMKNLPLLYIKNVPGWLVIKYLWKFNLAYALFFARAVTRWQIIAALKGYILFLYYAPSKLLERYVILSRSHMTTKDFDAMLVHDLPPNAKLLRKLRKAIIKK